MALEAHAAHRGNRSRRIGRELAHSLGRLSTRPWTRRPAGTPTKKITINRPVEDVRRIWQDARGRSGLFPHLAEHANAISFATAFNGRGTEVTLTLSAIKSRKAGSLISRALGRVTGMSAVRDVDRELRVLKQLVETGEVSRSEATAHGHPHPAIPLSQKDAERAREKVAA